VTALVCRGITKRYDALTAVAGATLEVRPGKIHAVVGENGAGKSTLLKIAAGIVAPNDGEVQIDGRTLAPHTAREALRRGVAMVQQHFALVDVFTALENVVLGAEPSQRFDRLDLPRARERVRAIGLELGAELPLDTPVAELGIGDRQRVEIARALFRDADVLILDEPTSVLAPQEADALYAALRRLAERGRAVVVVTHKLDEVRVHADEATAMRRGKIVRHDERPAGGSLDVEALADAIMGDDKPPPVERRPHELGAVALRLQRGMPLEVRSGEIVGIAGVEGNGQRELVEALAGLDADVRDVEVLATPVSVVHEDRHDRGLVLDASVRDNLLLGELGAFARLGVLDGARMDAVASERHRRGGVRPLDLDVPARALSGGNQQKIVMVRAVSRGAKLLALAHPTRGVDLGAARAIHAQVLEAAGTGAAILVVSSDLAELRTLCDRVFVLRRGRCVASFDPSASDAAIGAAMLGGEAS
jgi:simple sugar transport system ATP-binding protein